MALKRKIVKPDLPTESFERFKESLNTSGAEHGRSPLARMIDAVVRCALCGVQGVNTCDCWIECKKCGMTHANSKHRERQINKDYFEGRTVDVYSCRG